jgi:hypothetical protein
MSLVATWSSQRGEQASATFIFREILVVSLIATIRSCSKATNGATGSTSPA